MDKLKKWFKNPRNIVFTIVMIAVAIYGIVNNIFVEIVKVYLVMALFGLLLGYILYLVYKLRK